VFIALVVLTVLLAVLALNSAAMKLRRDEQILASISGTVGVPERQLPVLAGLEIAGAAGILIGLWLEPLGIAAAIGLVAYFVGALVGHVRVGDTKGAAAPMVPLVLAIAVLVLRLQTA
jgi:uncharacterized membrane protein YphA (DoxX/SURF4 family)